MLGSAQISISSTFLVLHIVCITQQLIYKQETDTFA